VSRWEVEGFEGWEGRGEGLKDRGRVVEGKGGGGFWDVGKDHLGCSSANGAAWELSWMLCGEMCVAGKRKTVGDLVNFARGFFAVTLPIQSRACLPVPFLDYQYRQPYEDR
jgi:hypothetical protein